MSKRGQEAKGCYTQNGLLKAGRLMFEDESIPVKRPWFLVGAIAGLVFLGITGIAVVVCEPLLRASSAAAALHSRGMRMDYSESRLSLELRQLWRQLSERKLAVTAVSAYCESGSPSRVRDEDLIHVRAFPDIYSVDLRDQAITSAGLPHLSGLNLEALSLARTKVGSGAVGLQPLASLDKLRMLDLSRTQVVDDDLEGLSTLYHLQGLNLADTKVTAAGIAHLSGLTGLVSLNLDRTRVTDPILNELAGTRGLSHLELVGTKVTGAGFEKLARCGLKELRLTGSALSDAGLRGIGQISTLTGLSISRTVVSPAAMSHLANLHELRWLDMQGPGFGDDHLYAVSACNRLRELRISGSRITVRGVQALLSLKNLARLEIDGNLLKSDDVIRVLAQSPKLKEVDVRMHSLTELDVEAVQQQLGPTVRVFEVSDNPAQAKPSL
ncbi:MAG: F-box/LRR-repeat protein 14 [Planctomycetaceae bacterium]|nr:F-box/LRR-repeat protein 14 [Planctomycetaceae bacterium]